MRNREIHERWGTHKENWNIWRGDIDKYIWIRDIYGIGIQDLYGKRTNKVKIYTINGNIQKRNIGFIQRKDTHRVETYMEKKI